MTDLDKYSNVQILDGISRALTERNLSAAASLICVLAVRDPAAAEEIIATLRALDSAPSGEAT